MTTETERRVPEHPGWQPWWLRVAEYGGKRLVLHTWPEGELADDDPEKWGLCDGTCRDSSSAADSAGIVGTYSSLADAEAAFELACERLREGG